MRWIEFFYFVALVNVVVALVRIAVALEAMIE
jgi:hypothetical protein